MKLGYDRILIKEEKALQGVYIMGLLYTIILNHIYAFLYRLR